MTATSTSGETDPTLCSATRLAHLIRQRQVSSCEGVDAHIAAIERVNPRLNAVVQGRFEQAREEARRADVAVASRGPGELPPLLGVPCTIKEAFAVQGMPNACGVVARKDVTAREDATVVARLREAGAIPLGVTNTSELCVWMESDNRVYGRTNNAYDVARTAGGSSGGEGSIIGAGASPFGIGSDVGGSLRGPAFFNGVFGHRPSAGAVPLTGHYPMTENEALRYLTAGPLARRAEDLMPLLRIIAGPDGVCQGCQALDLGDPGQVDPKRLFVLDIPDDGKMDVSAALRARQRDVVELLRERGARMETRRLAALERQFDIFSAMLAKAQDTPVATTLGLGGTFGSLFEVVKCALGRSDHTLMTVITAAVEPVSKGLAGFSRRMCELGLALRTEIEELLGGDGILLYPSCSRTAPPHGWATRQALRYRFPQHGYMGVLSVLELPVTQVPLGLDAEGLPLGVQVAARHGNDHLTIAVATWLEEAFGGWRPPPPRSWL